MKMSEVFGDGVTSKSGQEVGKGCFDWDCGVLRKIEGGHVAEFDEVTESAAAAHAINNHDRLAAENEALKIMLKRLSGTAIECDGWESFPSEILDEVNDLLATVNNN